MRKSQAEKLGGVVKSMRHTIYDRTKADVEISAPGENLRAYQKVRRISYVPIKKLGAHQKVRRISSAPSYYLGSAESPTADFLQVWLKSSRSGPRRWCCLLFMQTSSDLKAQTALLLWAASLPYCTGLLYQHDLSKPLRMANSLRAPRFSPFPMKNPKIYFGF